MFQIHQKICLLPVQAKSEKINCDKIFSERKFLSCAVRVAPFGLRYENELVNGKNHLLLKITGGCLGQQTC